MWAVFDPCNMSRTLAEAKRLDPDPEEANWQGRFVSLFKSLVYTVKYRSLEPFKSLSVHRFCALYQELTGHLLEVFVRQSAGEGAERDEHTDAYIEFPLALDAKERLRRSMLSEVWAATIEYIAEIRSDRDSPMEPITMCLPDHLRWTIHPKQGQLGLLMPSALGKPIQAWAGAPVFKRVGENQIKLCTMPVLVLEAAGAIPVHGAGETLETIAQPLFYMYPDVALAGIDTFLADLPSRLTRKRAS
jgi:hypothetical protein